MPNNNPEASKYNASLSESDFKEFLDLAKTPSPEAMKSKISSSANLTRLVKTHFKQQHEDIGYGISVATLQERLVGERYNLGTFGKNGVDGDFGKNTFVAILQAQKALGLKPTGVANLDLLKYLFPRKFKTLNKKEGRSVTDTRGFVDERIKLYRDGLEEKRTSIKQDTRKQLLEETGKILKDETTTIDKKTLLAFYRKKYSKPNKKIQNSIFGNDYNKRNGYKSKDFIKYKESFGVKRKYFSLPMEKIGDMTYCSRTARKNLYRFGIQKNKVAHGDSAQSSMDIVKSWRKNRVNGLDNIPAKITVMDVYVDSSSQYEHRVVAYKYSNNWFVLDPYNELPSNKNNRILPIPIDEYRRNMKIIGAFGYIV